MPSRKFPGGAACDVRRDEYYVTLYHELLRQDGGSSAARRFTVWI